MKLQPHIDAILDVLKSSPLPEQVQALNQIRIALHEVSPFKGEPVDCVVWVPSTDVHANDYNPNSVAPPEMKLLEVSILEDGYTQPIVSWSSDRIASTIRHNRARGKHKVDSMSEIVVELKRRNWNDEKIARELGMDPDEVLRLCQITGLAEMFQNQEFSASWEIGEVEEDEIQLEEII